MNFIIFIGFQNLWFFKIIHFIFVLNVFKTISFCILIIAVTDATLNIIFKNINFLNKSHVILVITNGWTRTIFSHTFYHNIIIKWVIVGLSVQLRRIIFFKKIEGWLAITYIWFFKFIFYQLLTSCLNLLLLIWSASASTFWSYKLLLPANKRIVRFNLNLTVGIFIWKWWIFTLFITLLLNHRTTILFLINI